MPAKYMATISDPTDPSGSTCHDCDVLPQQVAQYEKVKREAARLATEVERLDKEVIRQKTLRWVPLHRAQHSERAILACFNVTERQWM